MSKSSTSIFTSSAKEAYKCAGRNKLRRYPSPDQDAQRLYPLANPSVTPSFHIDLSDTIFALGSCFARNVEGALQKAGMNVISRDLDLGKIGESVGAVGNFFNKYTVHSIYNDLKWALERDSFPGEDVLLPLVGGGYCDLQLGILRLDFPLAEIMDFRHRYLDTLAQVANADVLVITLGYVETWYDTVLGVYLNSAPPRQLCTAYPDRFEFRVLGFQDVLDGLNDIYDLLVKHRKKSLKMLLTVSPVPLVSTFRDMDVLVANTYSKSVQRAAVETFSAEHEGVDYFPSYEFVTLSNPAISWARGDYRHVSPDLVERIMSNIITNYVSEFDHEQGTYGHTPMTDTGVLATARLLDKLGETEDLVTLVEENPEIINKNASTLLALASYFERNGKPAKAIEALIEVIELSPERPIPLQRLIGLTAKQKRSATRLKELLALHKKRFPTREGFRRAISKQPYK